MRILHTSDWHLGKYLESFSRLDEQKLFLNELNDIVEQHKVELILIAGDIYDTPNPPANAEQLFFENVKKLSNFGKRPVIIIAGNHDGSSRLTAPTPLATPQGIIVFGTQNCIIPKGEFEHFSIVDSGQGFIELSLNGQNVVISVVPYPSEKRLNELLPSTTDENELQKSYSGKVKYLFDSLSSKYRDDTINIAMSHLYIVGGETSKSERDISIGGSYAVYADALPKKAQYIAMGHLHKAQKVIGHKHAFYSGSPIQYSKNESNHSKYVYIVDVLCGEEPVINRIQLKKNKPIIVIRADSVENALDLCEKHKDESSYIYLEIYTDRVILQDEIKKMRTLKNDIVEILPIFAEDDEATEKSFEEEKTINEQFVDFYFENKNTFPTEEILELFLELVEEASK